MIAWERNLAGARVLLTGHSGFTGTWACLWLRELGASVFGLALPPETVPNVSDAVKLDSLVDGAFVDIRDLGPLCARFREVRPDLVLHLAAQPLVRRSYTMPIETFDTNAMGTINVLTAAQRTDSVKGLLCVTTDKVYENSEGDETFKEGDPLGGKDPYSASKAAAEIAIRCWKESFFETSDGPLVAVARGGNIVGGGDWAEDRLVPDFVRAVQGGEPMVLRYPGAIRPWQHVLALVQGYLMILAGLAERSLLFAQPFNFGPREQDHLSVKAVVETLGGVWRMPSLVLGDPHFVEAMKLRIDSTKARDLLGWEPVWDIKEALERTGEWYRRFYAEPSAALDVTLDQLQSWRGLMS